MSYCKKSPNQVEVMMFNIYLSDSVTQYLRVIHNNLHIYVREGKTTAALKNICRCKQYNLEGDVEGSA